MARRQERREHVQRTPISLEHAALGTLLRDARTAAGATTRSLGYSSGHISNVERGHATPSRDLVQIYVRLFDLNRSAADGLLDRIEHDVKAAGVTRRRGQRAAIGKSGHQQPSLITANTRGTDIRDHYVVDSYEVEFTMNERGAITAVDSCVAIRGVTPNVAFYFTGHAPDSVRRRPRPPQVAALSGCTVERINVSPVGAAEVFFRLDRVLQPGANAHELSYRVAFGGNELADPAILYVTRPGIRSHTLKIRFAAPAVPTRIWSVAAPDSIAFDHPEPSRELPLRDDAVYERSFNELVPGWCYGLTWIWSDFD